MGLSVVCPCFGLLYVSYSLVSNLYPISRQYNLQVFKQLGHVVRDGRFMETTLQAGRRIAGYIANGSIAGVVGTVASIASSASSILTDPYSILSSIPNIGIFNLLGAGVRVSIPGIRGWIRNNNPEIEGSRAKNALLAEEKDYLELKDMQIKSLLEEKDKLEHRFDAWRVKM